MRFLLTTSLVIAAFTAGFYLSEWRQGQSGNLTSAALQRSLFSGAEQGDELSAPAHASQPANPGMAAPQALVQAVPESKPKPEPEPNPELQLSPLEQAQRWVAKGEYAPAVTLLEALLAAQPQATEAMRLLARVYEHQGQHERAVATWFDYLSTERDAQQLAHGLQYLSAYLLRLADNPLFFAERLSWLMQQLNDLIRLTSDNGGLHLRLAELHLAEQDTQLAQYHALMAVNQTATRTPAQALLKLINGDDLTELASGGELKIPLRRLGKQFLVPVNIDGIAVRLLLDTGASISGLRGSFIDRHYRLVRETKPIMLNTANGSVNSYVFVVNNLSLGSADFNQHLLARLPMQADTQFDGLLGVDILGRFEFFIDQEKAELRLRKP